MSSFLVAAINIYIIVIVVRALFSWLPPQHRQNDVYFFVLRITEPVLAPVRRALPPMGGLDLSPLVVIVLGQVIARLLASSGL